MQAEIFAADLVYPGPSLKSVQLLTSTLSSDFPHAWGGDNQTVYFESNRVGVRYHIFRQRLDSSSAEMLGVGDKQQFFPAIMPDGKTLVYEEWADVNGQTEKSIQRADSDGTNASLVWKESKLDEWRCPLLSGSGCILRETEGERTFVFYALDLKSGRGRELARSAWEPTILGDWALSPDGSIVAIPNHDPRARSIRLVPLDGSGAEREIKLQDATVPLGLQWTPDGKGFYCEAKVGTRNQLQLIDLSGKARVLRQGTSNTWGFPSKDGKKLAFADSTIVRNVFLWR